MPFLVVCLPHSCPLAGISQWSFFVFFLVGDWLFRLDDEWRMGTVVFFWWKSYLEDQMVRRVVQAIPYLRYIGGEVITLGFWYLLMCSNNWPLKASSLKGCNPSKATNLPSWKCIWGGTRDMMRYERGQQKQHIYLDPNVFYFRIFCSWKLFANPGSKTAEFPWHRWSGDSHDEMSPPRKTDITTKHFSEKWSSS